MTLVELHAIARDYSGIKFDPRINIAMNEGEFEAMRSNNGCNYYFYLRNLVSQLRPRNVLELGTSIGRSGLFMMLALPPESKFTTIEMGSWMRGDLAPFFDDNRLRIVYGSDVDNAVYSPLELKDVDLLFIDTVHEIEHVKKEWSIYSKVLSPGALVVMDDIHLNDGMSTFWDSIPYEKMDVGLDVHLSGFGMFRFNEQFT
jgi:predicted O-methyltransferase YrrM